MTALIWARDALAALLVTLIGCGLLGWFVAAPAAPFNAHLRGRVLRMMGRAVVVLAIIAVGIGALNGKPGAVLLGAIGGWLIPSLIEVRKAARHTHGPPGQGPQSHGRAGQGNGAPR